MTQTISTIVDGIEVYLLLKSVYMTQTISTIVDMKERNGRNRWCLYDPNNFYYCRLMGDGWRTIGLYDPNNFYYCR